MVGARVGERAGIFAWGAHEARGGGRAAMTTASELLVAGTLGLLNNWVRMQKSAALTSGECLSANCLLKFVFFK